MSTKYFKNFECISWKNPDNGWNEDCVGVVGNTFWVIDGATSVGKEKLYPDFSTDAEGFAFCLSRGLEKFSLDESRSLKDILGDALVFANSKSSIGNRFIPGNEMPGASLVMVRVGTGYVDYLRLGDSEIYFSQQHLLLQDRLHKEMDADMMAEIRMVLKERGTNHFETKEFYNLVQKRRATQNTPGGYYVATPDSAGLQQSEVGRLESVESQVIYLWSDGFGNLFETYGAPLALLEQESISTLAEAVRFLESGDKEREQYSRFKTYDDLSVIKITL